jgi:hypothetical protein
VGNQKGEPLGASRSSTPGGLRCVGLALRDPQAPPEPQSTWPLSPHHLDRFEVQEEATGGALRFVFRPQHEVIEELVEIYRRMSDDDTDPNPEDMLEAMNPTGEAGSVNPLFFAHVPHHVPADECTRLLDCALANLPELWRADAPSNVSPGPSSSITKSSAAKTAARAPSQGASPRRQGSSGPRRGKKTH